MRKKPWAMPYIKENSNFAILDPTINKGKWSKILDKEEINLEIGFGKGSYINNMSKIYPNSGWIGIEKDVNAAAVGIKNCLDDCKRDNLLMVVNDASNINEWFNDGEISNIYLNFSDPWPKKAHTKRRLTSDTFINQYRKILKNDGKIIMKTDNSSLFEFSLLTFLKYDFKLEYINVDFRRDIQEDPITEYEQRFIELNNPIYKFIITKQEG